MFIVNNENARNWHMSSFACPFRELQKRKEPEKGGWRFE